MELQYRLRALTPADLDLVLEWRNRPEVRENMYTTHVISREEHYAFFEQVWGDETRRYLICEHQDGTPVGVVSFAEIDPKNATASWAFYSGDLERRGVGTNMEFLALEYAFMTLGLRKLSCEVLDFNRRVIEFHRRFGFKVEGILRKHHWTGNRFADVYRLAVFHDDWEKHLQAPFRRSLVYPTQPGPLDPGRSHEVEITLTRDQIRAFAEVTGDENPVHLDPAAARDLGFEGLIAHGMLGAALFSRVLGQDFPGPGTIYLRQELTFCRPIHPGTRLKVRVRVLSKVGRLLTLETTIRDDRETLTRGEADVLVPRQETSEDRVEGSR